MMNVACSNFHLPAPWITILFVFRPEVQVFGWKLTCDSSTEMILKTREAKEQLYVARSRR
jgi:hypothetical protein